jgi:trehalose-6-phosphatase
MRGDSGVKVFVERRKERAMKVPNVNEVGEHGCEICAVDKRMWSVECSDNRRKK